MALRTHFTALAIAVATTLCTVGALYGQGPKKAKEELQYVPPSAREVYAAVIGHGVRNGWAD